MNIKCEVLATANTCEELLDPQKRKAEELHLLPPQQDLHNDWGPIFSDNTYDLRIDKKIGMEQYELHLLHKLQPRGLIDRLRQR
ncbi:MAG: hypothetical protein H0X37_03455 [Herpetosiphonaceae bacterium]|nr:hypothetical protein [Herpetosiphonaceae bacterium]